MGVYVIADEDTVRGFALAGVEGVAVGGEQETRAALSHVIANRHDIDVLVLTDVTAAEASDVVSELRTRGGRPLVTEIPSSAGKMQGKKSLRSLVQEAVGINVGDE